MSHISDRPAFAYMFHREVPVNSHPMRALFLPAIAGVAALVLSGCGKQPAAHHTDPLPAARVRVETIEKKQRMATEEVVGTVRAKLRSVVEAKISGRIEKLLVVPGQNVEAGELLAELDSRELQARVDQVRAVRQQAEADLQRFTSLFEQNILSQSEFDAAQSRFRVADANMIETQTLLGYGKVLAPFSGVITRKHADVGDLATPGRALLEIEDARHLRFEADVPEAVLDRIELNHALPVQIGAMSTNLIGTVSEISPAADPGSRTFLVKLDLPSIPGLRAGQFGRVAMPVGETHSIRVPSGAVIRRGQMEIVFAVMDGRARMRLVKTGNKVGDEVEVVSGLQSGETVVVEGAEKLLDHQPVEMQ